MTEQHADGVPKGPSSAPWNVKTDYVDYFQKIHVRQILHRPDMERTAQSVPAATAGHLRNFSRQSEGRELIRRYAGNAA